MDRIILIVVGLALAYCAVWGASEMHFWAIKHGMRERAFLFISYSAFFVGGLCLSLFFRVLAKKTYDEISGILTAVLNLACFSFVFGAIVAPIRNAADIEMWVTPWAFLLILGVLPMIVSAKGLVRDVFDAAPSEKEEEVGERRNTKIFK